VTVSRFALDLALEAYAVGESTPEHRATIADAAQAVLDGEPLEWCAEHSHSNEWVDPLRCRFEAQVRIGISP
jgi:hypothetical protein